MIKHFIQHPVSVFMIFVALFIFGIGTYVNIPISLLPDIDIPKITVHLSASNISARELENNAVTPLRQRLMQISKLRDIKCETRDGSAIIHLSFEYGTNTDLAFIEVNEKIDGAMNFLPKEMERPKVIKASATDIPVLNINLTLRSDQVYSPTDINKFIELSDFSEAVIRRRFEQLPEVAMVDMSGLIKKQIVITPDMSVLEVNGISIDEFEHVLQSNNTDPGNMYVRDGYFEYNIRFTSALQTIEDIENIFIRKNDRIYKLKDLAKVKLLPEKNKGMILYNGKRAIVLSIIKQSEERMNNMQTALGVVIKQFEKDFPDIEFNITQNQTELLDYTISNLKENLILAFLFVFFISVFFLKDSRSSLIIGIGLFVSLVISLLFFYLFKISLNIVSLTGLILASGMMIDNSIIVTDNIAQYRKKGLSLENAGIKGTNELIVPMLSSVLTTISVFVPLIFLSGIAGAIFFDQAFSVTVGLLVSYITGIIFLPVLYKSVYSIRLDKIKRWLFRKEKPLPEKKASIAEKLYNKGIDWVFSHKVIVCILMILVFPFCLFLFSVIEKEKMPNIKQKELLVNIEWNENIHLEENNKRCIDFLKETKNYYGKASTFIGEQQFMLNREKINTSTEVELYLETYSYDSIGILKEQINVFFEKNYPKATISFAPPGTIFEKIFTVGEADLIVEYYKTDKIKEIDKQTVIDISEKLHRATTIYPEIISFQNQLELHIDREKLLLYNIPYQRIYKALRTALDKHTITTLRSQQEYLPVSISIEKDKSISEILEESLIEISTKENGRKNMIALSSFVSVRPSEDVKSIVSGKAGEYLPFYYYQTENTEKLISQIKENVKKDNQWEINFSGGFFSNKKMLSEMIVILIISVLLMYFILAAQFENLKQPFIVLLELPIDIAASLLLLIVMGHTLNLMSAIGIVITCGIIINDSILKVDIINQLRREGLKLREAIHEAGKRRLKAILMTSMTSIVCMLPLLFSDDMGSQLEKPLAVATIGGMIIGTPVSLFVVPLAYWWIYRKEDKIKK